MVQNPIFSGDLVKFLSSKIFSTYTMQVLRERICHLAMKYLSLSLPLSFFSLLCSAPFAVTRQKLVACLAKCSPVPRPWSSFFQMLGCYRLLPFSSRYVLSRFCPPGFNRKEEMHDIKRHHSISR